MQNRNWVIWGSATKTQGHDYDDPRPNILQKLDLENSDTDQTNLLLICNFRPYMTYTDPLCFPVMLDYKLDLKFVFQVWTELSPLWRCKILHLRHKQKLRQKFWVFPHSQNFVEQTFAKLTAARLLRHVSNGLPLALWEVVSSSHTTDSQSKLTSGLWRDHFKRLKCFPLNHSSLAWAVCLGSLSCWKVNLSLEFLAN